MARVQPPSKRGPRSHYHSPQGSQGVVNGFHLVSEEAA